MKALVFLVSGIVLMLYVSVHLVVVFPQAHWYFHTTLGFLHYLFVNFLLATTCYSYYCIVSTGPGEVSLLWVPQGFTDEELEAAKTSEPHKKRSHAGLLPRPRYCSKCCVYKPPRSHHCSVCDRCVPRMDHHCPWVNNCVGNGNHKLFVVFLFWGVTGILYGLFLLLFRLILMFRAIFMDAPITVTPIQGAIIGINLVTLLPIVLGMISLFCWQMNLAGLNTTTIEFHEKQWQQRYFRTKRRKYRWPYDFGVCENFRVFFGYSYLTWFLPVPPKNLGDGMNYPMALSEETIEQMREWEREDEEAARRSEMEEVQEVDAPPAPTSLPDAVLSSETIRSRGEDRILSV